MADIKKMLLSRTDTAESSSVASPLILGSPKRKKSKGRHSLLPTTLSLYKGFGGSPGTFAQIASSNPSNEGISHHATESEKRTEGGRRWKGIRGSRSPDDNDVNSEFSSAQRYFEVYVGGCGLTTTSDGVRRYCDGNGIKLNEVEALNSKNPRFKSFRIQIEYKEKDTVLDPQFWLSGIIVRPFRFPRKSRE